jgi:hypothetical protein
MQILLGIDCAKMKESKTTPVIQSVAPAKNTGGLALTPSGGRTTHYSD